MVPERKIGNALIEHAKPDFKVYLIPLAMEGVVAAVGFAAVVAASKFLNGGLWVGGEIELGATTITFRPNAMNRALHKADYRVEIPLRDIIDVKNQFGLITGIIALLTTHGALKIRTYGAQDFAKRIQAQVAVARAIPST